MLTTRILLTIALFLAATPTRGGMGPSDPAEPLWGSSDNPLPRASRKPWGSPHVAISESSDRFSTVDAVSLKKLCVFAPSASRRQR